MPLTRSALAAALALAALSLAPLAAPGSATPDAQPNWVLRGNDAADHGRIREALNDYTLATEQIPLDPVPWFDRARMYSLLGKNAEALADAEHAVSLNAFFDEGFALIARLKQEMGKYGEALASIDRAVALKPQEDRYRLRRAELLRLLDRFPEAAAEYAAALKINASSRDALHGEAEALIAMRRDRDAIPYLKRYVAIAPENSDANVALAGLLVAAGRSQDALDFIKAHPSADASMMDYQVRALMQLGDRAAATAALPAPGPHDSAYRASLRGQLAFEAGRCREAEDAYRIAAAAHDATPLTWRNYGAASACAKDRPAALTALNRAIGLNPADALAYRYRADVFRDAGDVAGAIEDARAALRLGGENPDLLMMLGIDEYRSGARPDGLRDYARGCELLPAAASAKRRLCDEQLPKLRATALKK